MYKFEKVYHREYTIYKYNSMTLPNIAQEINCLKATDYGKAILLYQKIIS